MKALRTKLDRFALSLLRTVEHRRAVKKSVAEHRRYFGEKVLTERPFLNVGPGSWRHPAWKNLDVLQPKYASTPPDIIHDLMSELPIRVECESLLAAYCSHVIEHLSDSADAVLFRELYRALRPKGVLRLVFPDVDIAHRAFRTNDRTLFLESWPRPGNQKRTDAAIIALFVEFFAYQRLEKNIRKRLPGYSTYSNEELLDAITEAEESNRLPEFYDSLTREIPAEYQAENYGCHRNWWNYEKAERALREAGFETLVRSGYRQSSLFPLRNPAFFDRTQPEFSTYIEAIKG